MGAGTQTCCIHKKSKQCKFCYAFAFLKFMRFHYEFFIAKFRFFAILGVLETQLHTHTRTRTPTLARV